MEHSKARRPTPQCHPSSRNKAIFFGTIHQPPSSPNIYNFFFEAWPSFPCWAPLAIRLLKIGAQGDCSYHRSILAIRRLRAVACAAAGWNRQQRHGGAKSSKNAKQQHGGGGKFTSTWICCSGDFFGNPFTHGLHHHFKTTIWDNMSLFFNFFQAFFTSKSKSRTFFLLVENKEAFMFNKAHHFGIHFLDFFGRYKSQNFHSWSLTLVDRHPRFEDFWCRKMLLMDFSGNSWRCHLFGFYISWAHFAV